MVEQVAQGGEMAEAMRNVACSIGKLGQSAFTGFAHGKGKSCVQHLHLKGLIARHRAERVGAREAAGGSQTRDYPMWDGSQAPGRKTPLGKTLVACAVLVRTPGRGRSGIFCESGTETARAAARLSSIGKDVTPVQMSPW